MVLLFNQTSLLILERDEQFTYANQQFLEPRPRCLFLLVFIYTTRSAAIGVISTRLDCGGDE